MKNKVVAVSYLNTRPFIYGLQKTALVDKISLELAVPSLCAKKLLEGEAQIGLVPSGSLIGFPHYHIISNYCIAAEGEVDSVLLLSDIPLQQIKTIHLDSDSLTSVKLVKVLAEKYWKIRPCWVDLPVKTDSKKESVVLIGDKTFEERKNYRYRYDLALEWKNFTGLPFVFACWVSLEPINKELENELNHAFAWGISHIEELLSEMENSLLSKEGLRSYYKNNIVFELDEKKREALRLFLQKIS